MFIVNYINTISYYITTQCKVGEFLTVLGIFKRIGEIVGSGWA